MFDEDNIERYIHRVNQIVKSIQSISGKLNKTEIVRKVLLTLPKFYKPKKYVIE